MKTLQEAQLKQVSAGHYFRFDRIDPTGVYAGYQDWDRWETVSTSALIGSVVVGGIGLFGGIEGVIGGAVWGGIFETMLVNIGYNIGNSFTDN